MCVWGGGGGTVRWCQHKHDHCHHHHHPDTAAPLYTTPSSPPYLTFVLPRAPTHTTLLTHTLLHPAIDTVLIYLLSSPMLGYVLHRSLQIHTHNTSQLCILKHTSTSPEMQYDPYSSTIPDPQYLIPTNANCCHTHNTHAIHGSNHAGEIE